uniref:Nuclear receptor n=1 Tax=Rhabditophanes sp. KR3021 TaxID=114890 RepID=A0AC35UEG0_9BILA
MGDIGMDCNIGINDIFRTHNISPKLEINQDDSSVLECSICHDRAAGKHYSVVSCNGCKGFFRRTIRRNYKYTCRFDKKCIIDKLSRANCRACRFDRCIHFGMKIDAVQNERDLIGKRANSSYKGGIKTESESPPAKSMLIHRLSQTEFDGTKQNWSSSKSILMSLLHFERKMKHMRDTVIKKTNEFDFSLTSEHINNKEDGRVASVNDIFTSLSATTELTLNWAFSLAPFAELSNPDKVVLLKNFAPQNVVLCLAFRSMANKGHLTLLNDCIIDNKTDDINHGNFYKNDCERIMRECVDEMFRLQVDDVEFVALKAAALFNNTAPGISKEGALRVLDIKKKVLRALTEYVQNKINDPSRIGDLVFSISSSLRVLASSVVENVLLSSLIGIARMDSLITEYILHQDKQTDQDDNASTNQDSGCTSSPEQNISPIPYLNEHITGNIGQMIHKHHDKQFGDIGGAFANLQASNGPTHHQHLQGSQATYFPEMKIDFGQNHFRTYHDMDMSKLSYQHHIAQIPNLMSWHVGNGSGESIGEPFSSSASMPLLPGNQQGHGQF